MTITTMRLGLLLFLALVIIQISKAESETEEQNELEKGSEAAIMASSLEEAQLRTVREAGKKKSGNNKGKKGPKKTKGKKKSRRNKNKAGRRTKKNKGAARRRSGKGSSGRRPKKGKKDKDDRRKPKKDLKKKKKKGRQNKNGKRHKKIKIKKQGKSKKEQTVVARQGTCDEAKLCQKIKDYIKYSNQLRKVRRIVKSCDTMDKKATKAATEFSATVAALDQVISGNAKRQLYIRWRRTKRSTDEVVAIRDNLKNCSASAKAKCEKSVEPACAESAIHTECDAALEAWLKSFGPSKGSCLQASADCCACITALPEVDAKCLDFEAKSKAAVLSKKKCTGGTETGSFGFCRKQQQDASVKGPKAACGGSTATKAPGASTTKAATGASTAAQGIGICKTNSECPTGEVCCIPFPSGPAHCTANCSVPTDECIQCNITCCELGEVYIPCNNGEKCPTGYHCCGQFGCWKDGSGCPPTKEEQIDMEDGVCPAGSFTCQTPDVNTQCCGRDQICGCRGCWVGLGPVCPKCPEICPEIYEPICGINNQTYANKCFGCEVETACNGKCPCKGRCESSIECPLGETCCPPKIAGGSGYCSVNCSEEEVLEVQNLLTREEGLLYPISGNVSVICGTLIYALEFHNIQAVPYKHPLQVDGLLGCRINGVTASFNLTSSKLITCDPYTTPDSSVGLYKVVWIDETTCKVEKGI